VTTTEWIVNLLPKDVTQNMLPLETIKDCKNAFVLLFECK